MGNVATGDAGERRENPMMMKHLRAVPAAGAGAALLATVLTVAGCCGDGGRRTVTRYPQPGEAVSMVVLEDDTPGRAAEATVVYEATYRYHELPEAESHPDTVEQPTVVPLLESETFHSTEFEQIQLPVNPVTLEELRDFLRDHWDAHIEGAGDDGWNIEHLLTYLHNHRMSLEEFLHWFEQSGQTLEDFLQTLALTRSRPVQTRAGGLAVAKFVWQLVKDNKPIATADGAFTDILSSQDKEPLNYQYARNDSSSQYTWKIVDSLFGWVLVECKFRVRCTYHATHPDIPGHYVPSLYVDFNKINLKWPFSLDGTAFLSNVSNLGGTDANPQADILVDVDAHNFAESFSRSWSFRVTGLDGVRRL
jgi:hypothetical protein